MKIWRHVRKTNSRKHKRKVRSNMTEDEKKEAREKDKKQKRKVRSNMTGDEKQEGGT